MGVGSPAGRTNAYLAPTANETATGLGATTAADIQKALELAEQADVFLMLTIFSFDNFRPSADIAGIWTPGITPMVKDPTKRSQLLNKVVRPVAQTVKASPYARRVIAWDVINEPEWAMTGPSPYGDAKYEPEASMLPVTHKEMETFVAEIVTVLRSESSALISVGAAAFKWSHAWKNIDTDFHHFHMYQWINTWWPYTGKPSDYGLGDKPLVMGELPMGDLAPGIPYLKVLKSWWSNGYAGVMSWQYNQATATGLDDVKSFSDLHTCQTSFSSASGKMWPPSVSSFLLPTTGTSRVGRLCAHGPDGRPFCP